MERNRKIFKASWEYVYRAVQLVIEYGLANRILWIQIKMETKTKNISHTIDILGAVCAWLVISNPNRKKIAVLSFMW